MILALVKPAVARVPFINGNMSLVVGLSWINEKL